MDIFIDIQTKSHTIWIWQRRGNFKREIKPLRMAVKNNAIRTNYDKVTIDKTQKNAKCKLYGDRDGPFMAS